MIVPILSFFLFFRYRTLLLLITICMYILVFFSVKNDYFLFNLPGDKFWVLGVFEYKSFVKLATYFFMGSLIYVYQDKVRFNVRFLLLAVLVLLISIYQNYLQYTLLICLPYVIVATGIGFRFEKFNKYGDFSYGMYIYAFPVQQSVVYLWNAKLSLTVFFMSSFLITLLFSALSWKFIEEPALKLKNYF
jgi:peptidoglycan/LPS O-acetylase OafA/YrhL